jgi:hypothetical protein
VRWVRIYRMAEWSLWAAVNLSSLQDFVMLCSHRVHFCTEGAVAVCIFCLQNYCADFGEIWYWGAYHKSWVILILIYISAV